MQHLLTIPLACLPVSNTCRSTFVPLPFHSHRQTAFPSPILFLFVRHKSSPQLSVSEGPSQYIIQLLNSYPLFPPPLTVQLPLPSKTSPHGGTNYQSQPHTPNPYHRPNAIPSSHPPIHNPQRTQTHLGISKARNRQSCAPTASPAEHHHRHLRSRNGPLQ